MVQQKLNQPASRPLNKAAFKLISATRLGKGGLFIFLSIRKYKVLPKGTFGAIQF